MGISYSASIPIRTGAERATLVRRTYGLVFLSIIVTMLGTAFGFTQPRLMQAVGAHPIITFFCALAPLWMVMSKPREYPRNLILTFLFTFLEGIFISPWIYVYSSGGRDMSLVAQAGGLTLSAFAVLSLYAVVSRRDFSAWGSFFMVGLWVLIATSLLNIFFGNTTTSLWLSAGTVLVFSGLLVFDTWRIVRSGQYGENDYVAAAVNIYLDLINMFLAILNLLGSGRRN
jgi:FtsH-binding integral membrane protein